MRLALIGAGLCLMSGCAYNQIDYRAPFHAAERPEATADCRDWAFEDGERPDYSDDFAMFLFAAQQEGVRRGFDVSYDITPAGRTANIRIEAPEYYYDHAAWQMGMDAAIEAVSTWTFRHEGPGAPGWAADCKTEMGIVLEVIP